nr:InlB B-repeat-containing protein [Finegoldia magna]
MDNYVKVIFKAGEGGTVSGDLVYYVSPEVEVDMTESAEKITKTANIGYFVKGEKWTNKDNKTLKGTFADPETEFVFTFDKSKDIVEKTNDPNQVIPKDYVKVTFKTEDANKGKLEDDKLEKIYFVNPKAEIKLVELTGEQKASEKQLAVPKTAPAKNYEFDKWYEEIDTETAITSERIYVAKFKLAKVTLTYEAGEGAKGEVPAKVEVDNGTTIRLARADNLSKENAKFAGWKLDGEDKIYKPGDSIKLEKARTATAQWKSVEYKVTFDSKGGNDVPSQTVEHGKTATEPKAPTHAGKVFMGWKEKEADTKYFDFTTPITSDKTLIAIWQDPVQKINDTDPVEEQFIKVTFLKGSHGTLKDGETSNLEKVTYKVAKGLEFKDVKGIVPGIAPAKYYKAKKDNAGWDKKLELNGQNAEFTAQYELIADVIPIDPAVTPDDKLQEDKPEGMVLVTFVVPEEKAYMDTTSKFYVARDKVVTIKPPVVYNKVDTYEFTEWQGKTLQEGMLVESYKDDTTIPANGVTVPEMEIKLPQVGDEIVTVIKNTEGATGKLVVIVNGEEKVLELKEKTTKRRKGRRFVTEKTVYFELPQAVQSGDSIKYWAEKDGIKSPIKYYTVE